jgi:hypothetical protein
MFCNGDLDKARLWGKFPPLMCRPDTKRAAVAIAGELNPQTLLKEAFYSRLYRENYRIVNILLKFLIVCNCSHSP